MEASMKASAALRKERGTLEIAGEVFGQAIGRLPSMFGIL
jgi:hypothetical protein